MSVFALAALAALIGTLLDLPRVRGPISMLTKAICNIQRRSNCHDAATGHATGAQELERSKPSRLPVRGVAPPSNFRDFVPWRFSDAGRHRPYMASSCRRPRSLHRSRNS